MDGQTPYGPVVGTWFRCRAHTPTFQERQADASFEYVRDLTLTVGLKDNAGVLLDPADWGDKHIELDCDDRAPALSGSYRVMGDPEPVTTKRRMKLWVVALRREASTSGSS